MYQIIKYAVLIGIAGLLSNSINAASHVTGAMLNYHQGDFETAMFQFQQIASETNTPEAKASETRVSQAGKANFMLGSMYERGDGVLIDDQIARSYYEKSAHAGYAEAIQRLQAFGSEESVVQDWYMESAWDGDIDAQYNLGYLFETGIGVSIDKARAIQWYVAAAKEQNANAQFRLGLMLITPEVQSRKYDEGKAWLKASADNGHIVALAMVEKLFEPSQSETLIRVARGVRTYEHSLTSKMLSVIDQSIVVKALAQSSPQPQPRFIVAPPSVSLQQTPLDIIFAEQPSVVILNVKKDDAKLIEISKPIETSKLNVIDTTSTLNMSFVREIKKDEITQPSSVPRQKQGVDLLLVAAGVGIVLCALLMVGYFWRKHLIANAAEYKIIAFPSNAPRYSETRRVKLAEENKISNEPLKLSVQLCYEDFLPVASIDVILHKRKAEEIIFEIARDSIALNDSHAVSNIIEMSGNIDVSVAGGKHSSLLNKLEALADEDSTLGLSAGYHQITDERIKDNSMSTLTEMLNKERAGFNGDGVSEAYVESLSDVDHSVKLADSYYNIGKMFIQGDGIAVNKQLGIRWLQKAVDHGHRLADAELAVNDRENVLPEYLQMSSAS